MTLSPDASVGYHQDGIVQVKLVLVQLLPHGTVLPPKMTLPDVPKLLPLTVTVVPARPDVGLMLVITGADWPLAFNERIERMAANKLAVVNRFFIASPDTSALPFWAIAIYRIR